MAITAEEAIAHQEARLNGESPPPPKEAEPPPQDSEAAPPEPVAEESNKQDKVAAAMAHQEARFSGSVQSDEAPQPASPSPASTDNEVPYNVRPINPRPQTMETIVAKDEEAELPPWYQTLVKNTIEAPFALAEVAATMGTGMLASGIGGVATGVTVAYNAFDDFANEHLGFDPYGNPHPIRDALRPIQEDLTYIPKSKLAQQYAAWVAWPFQEWEKGAAAFGHIVEEKTGSPMAGAVAKSAVDVVPMLVGGRNAPRAVPKIKGAAIGGYNRMMDTKVGQSISSAIDIAQTTVAPISTGAKAAKVAAKNYANQVRAIQLGRNFAIERLTTPIKRGGYGLKESEFKILGKALQEEELAFITETALKKGEGLASLSPNQHRALSSLMIRHDKVASMAVELKMLGSKRDIYMPRKLREVVGEKSAERINDAVLSTGTKHSMKRKYETVEETAAAASRVKGVKMEVIDDIRVLPLVTAELEMAVLGKQLINQIKQNGRHLGVDVVKVGGKPTKGYFTIADNPAFYETKIRYSKFKQADGSVKTVPAREVIKLPNGKLKEGKVIFDKKPIQIHNDWKAPLEAVLKNDMSKPVKFAMTVKSKAMHMIMFSPIMHGLVIWGKALPYQAGRGLTFANYRDGFSMRTNAKTLEAKSAYVKTDTSPAFSGFTSYEAYLRKAADDGLAPMTKAGWMQKMTDEMATPNLGHGNSTTAGIIGATVKVVGGKKGQQAAYKAVDAMGNFWHNTLLWDRIRDMQLGLYNNVKVGLIKKGMDADVAGKVAAHLGNRFAGMIPKEDMGHSFRTTLNLLLFSRTFNATNAGIYKDAFRGLPPAVVEQLLALGKSNATIQAGNKALSQGASFALVKDIAAMYVLNDMFQNAFHYFQTMDLEEEGIINQAGELVSDPSKILTGDAQGILDQYKNNMAIYRHAVDENVLNALFSLEELTVTSKNDPGKHERIRIGEYDDGTQDYARNPIGKIGEDLMKLIIAPIQMAEDKLAPTPKALFNLMLNDQSGTRGYGIEIYNEDAEGIQGLIDNIGLSLKYLAMAHTPRDAIEAAQDVLNGEDPDGRQYRKIVAQTLFGISFSKGVPGGAMRGEFMAVADKQARRLARNRKEINKLIKLGDDNQAIQVMIDKAGMTPNDAVSYLVSKKSPKMISKSDVARYIQYAGDEAELKLQAMIERQLIDDRADDKSEDSK